MLRRRGSWTIALVVALLAPPTGLAEDAPPATPPLTEAVAPVNPATDPLTELNKRVTDLEAESKKEKEKQLAKSAEAAKKPSINWTMQIQTDAVWSGQDADSRLAAGDFPDGFAFRRARVGMYGEHGPWEYRLAMDFALSGRPTFIDNYLALNDVPVLNRVRVGHFFEPFGLEYYSQNRFLTFLERSLPSEVLGPPRNLGVMANGAFANERGTWAVGYFRSDSDVFGDDAGHDFRSAGTGRVTHLLWYDKASDGRDLLHVGASYSARGTRNDQIRFRARPEIRIGSTDPNIPFLADTGTLPAHFYQLINTEMLWVRGPFYVQGEYQLMPVSTTNAGAAYFQTWYAMAGLFLTGEHRAYRTRTGVLERVVPRRDFVKKDACGLVGGPGAWEIAFRVSQLDLNSGAIAGGHLTDLTFGLNWYLSPYVRMTANYVRAYHTPANGDRGVADIFGLRMGYEF